jgi:hypothetical protein
MRGGIGLDSGNLEVGLHVGDQGWAHWLAFGLVT